MSVSVVHTILPATYHYHNNHNGSYLNLQYKLKIQPLCLNKPSFSLKCSNNAVQDNPTPIGGCGECGREKMEKGCNGKGRIQGGIATVPGFGWWPIKAYRPCPGLIASGGTYKRYGQSLDEVGFGRAEMSMTKETKEEA